MKPYLNGLEFKHRPRSRVAKLSWLLAAILLLLFSSISFAQELPWLKVDKLKITNEFGEEVRLNGINLSNNVWGNWVAGVSESLEAQGKDPLIRPQQQDNWVLTSDDFTRLRDLSPKVVRYAINYELFAENNPHRQTNLDKLKEHINQFERSGLYVIVSLHLPPGLNVQNDIFERQKLGSERLRSIFENEEYWNNTVSLWQYLAKNLKNMSAIAGYSLFNEPRLPSNEDGGIDQYKKKCDQLIRAIRQVDQRHMIFFPEYNSKERDDKDQSVSWERGFVKVEDPNVVYVFSFYEPYEYTHQGSGDFNENALAAQYLLPKINWAKIEGRAPVLICEYGLNRKQPVEKRLKYLKFIHKFSKDHDLSAIYWEYKSWVGSFINDFNVFGLYADYVNEEQEIIVDHGSYSYQTWAQKEANANNFDQLFKKYYWQNKTKVSLLDNGPIWQELNDFYK